MSGPDKDPSTKVLRGIVAGAVAGVAASFAMDRFQAAISALSASDEDGAPATDRAADAAEFRPGVTAGYATVFGTSTATLFDEGLVPAAGLGEAPWKAAPSSHLYSYASHLVFGAVTEIVRRRVARTLTA